MTVEVVIGLTIGLLVGGALGAYFVGRARAELRERQIELAQARSSAATDEQMLAAFKSVSVEALAQQSQQLVELAEAKYGTLQATTDTVLTRHGTNVSDGLKELSERLTSLERERATSTVQLATMVESLSQATTATREEAARLASAMRDNRVRGVWGEVQLRRALELAGLDRHVDFVEQRGSSNGLHSGRPDAVVAIANDRCVVIDSKVPLDRYLDAANETDSTRVTQLHGEHARAVAGHVKALAGRDYAGMVSGSVDLVLLFLPGEPFLSAALDADPTLFESAAAKGVYLVTPSSLIPILRGIALGWRERQAEEAAAEIHQLGVELHERIAVFADHYAKVGAQLAKTVDVFNNSVGSLDSRVLSTARKLSEHGAMSTKMLPDTPQVEIAPRKLKMVSVDAAPDSVPDAALDATPSASLGV